MHKNKIKYRIISVYLMVCMFSPFGKFYAQITDTLPINAVATDSGMVRTEAVVDLSRVRIGSGGLDDKVQYAAEDSIWFDVKNKQVHLYGNATVNYTSINLKAGYILLDYQNNTITGKPITDSLGQVTGIPEFADKDQKFSAKELKYNFKTKKGLIKEAYTTQENLYVLGKKAKFVTTESRDSTKEAQNTVYNEDALITTCDHPEPHFGIRAKKLKVVPEKLVVVGPSLVEIGGVPTPLILPFGFFPITKTRKQGVIIPRDFNLNDPRGLGIRDFGYYIPLGEHADLKLNLDYYLRGSHTIGAISRYNKRYKYNGNLNIAYTNTIGEDQFAQKTSAKSYRFIWSHNQDAKANPKHKYGGNINIQTNRDQQRNFNDYRSVYTNNLNSTFRYNPVFINKPYTLNASFTHSQVTSTRRMTVSFPNVDFNLRQIFPFKRKEAVGGERWYERVSLTYASKLQNTFSAYDSTFFRSSTLDSARFAIDHRANSDVQLKLFKYINIAPRVGYQESWYWRTIERTLDPTIDYVFDTIDDNGETIYRIDSAATQWGTVRTNMLKGFKPFRTFDAGISANTSLYFTRLRKSGWLRGFRHVITPNVSFNYAPDFTKDRYDYFRTYLTDVRPDKARTQEYSIFDEAQFGRPSNSTPPLSIGYSLRNVLEMKYFSKRDTTSKKIMLFNNLTFSGNYSLTADSLKWSPITTGGTFRLFKNYTTLNWNMSFDPYVYEAKTGKRLNTFLIKEQGKLLRVSTLGVSVNTSLSVSQIRGLFSGSKETQAALPNETPDDFAGIFNQFRFNHILRMDKRTLVDGRDTFAITNHSIGINGQIPLTSKWSFDVHNISYDFNFKQLVYPDIGISRDLHCWVMSMSWQPVRGTYSFYINVKPGPLDFLRLPFRKNNAERIFAF